MPRGDGRCAKPKGTVVKRVFATEDTNGYANTVLAVVSIVTAVSFQLEI